MVKKTIRTQKTKKTTTRKKNNTYIIVKIPDQKKKMSSVLAGQLGFAAEQELLYFADFRAYYAPGSSMRGQQGPDEGPGWDLQDFLPK